MKVRLHKGPQHGKKYEVRDGETTILLTKTKPYGLNWSEDFWFDVTTIKYEMVMLNVSGRMIPSIDPNGYYYFEYKG